MNYSLSPIEKKLFTVVEFEGKKVVGPSVPVEQALRNWQHNVEQYRFAKQVKKAEQMKAYINYVRSQL